MLIKRSFPRIPGLEVINFNTERNSVNVLVETFCVAIIRDISALNELLGKFIYA